jgi:hypothetical protein
VHRTAAGRCRSRRPRRAAWGGPFERVESAVARRRLVLRMAPLLSLPDSVGAGLQRLLPDRGTGGQGVDLALRETRLDRFVEALPRLPGASP